MKRIIIILCFSAFAASCNDDFMQRDPETEVAEGSFLLKADQLQYYLNSLYPLYVRGFENYWASDAYSAPWNNITGAKLLMYDRASDNVVQHGNADSRLTGTYSVPASNSGTAWSWSNLREVNYFLRNYTSALPDVAGDVTQLYPWAAEAYFFKAWEYFDKVKIYGDVPWFTRDLNIDSEELYATQNSRAEVMDSVLYCINFAVEHLPAPSSGPSGSAGRINKDMANFLKARICLYEGSYRTYHTELGLQSTAQQWLWDCEEACEAIIATGRYSLYGLNNGVEDPYWKLFTFNQTPEADGNTEAILVRAYTGSDSYNGHSTQRYWQMNRTRGSVGATRGMVDEYLCEDGRPIYIGGSEGNWDVNPLFEGYDGMWTELNNRDPRLRQTICRPGEFATIYEMATGEWSTPDQILYYPPIGYNAASSGIGTTVTGYWIIKWWMGDVDEYNATTEGTQTGLMFRYGEVLLNLAEAKCILGTLTDSDLERTVNQLRLRAGYDFAAYPDARLSWGAIPDDPRLDAVYADKLDYTVEPMLREIRRERRVELFMEAQRYDDMMRWKAGGLYTVPLRGMKMSDEKIRLYETASTVPPVVSRAVIGSDIFVDDEGFLIAYPRTSGISQGTLPWDDRRYLWPISTQDLNENPNLVQNPGW